jgi:integrase/recombinase XerC
MTKGNLVPRVVAGVLPGMVGRATQCICPYDPVLPRHLAVVASVHRGAKGRRGRADHAGRRLGRRGRAFLHHTEHERRGTIGTRNCRLAAIRSFFSFVADKDPEYIAQCAEVLTVPLKREPTVAPCYLEPEEVEAILAQPDRSTIEGMRDHVLLSFLYNSGARIQEALDLSRGDPVRRTELRASLRQGSQGTYLSALAGNRGVAQEVVGTSPARARSADLRQSIW